ncbi:sigma-70 family RNA polymerase sigma factor [Hymenobacter sp. 5317J-9]|uniref:RNA polymerase sigma factor n=1 Tax=Hymenobacter sp. 5317J-9 TaxID=2932250 RepID=UPI001FD64ED1|nr:sigma-70 family RNA polymerase sigma factor [Hymenobacter sp. 5317J-9]UOQ98050.1 sigma-70 family RNA polymerase sigma factor [Hymenobacter sp. 5317J-9]
MSATALRDALLANREQALTRLYRQAFPAVRRYVSRHGGSAEDAQDVFHDALVILYEQATGGSLVLTAAASTYLVGVARNLWLHELRRRARLPQDALPDDPAQLPAEAADAPEEPALAVLDYVERLGDRCKSILLAFYYFGQPLTRIAADHHFGSVRSATVQKFKCLERLRNSVRRAFRSETVDY